MERAVHLAGKRAGHPDHSTARPGQRLGGGGADAAGGTGHQGQAPGEDAHSASRPPCARRRNSTRVFESSRKIPRRALVTVREFCFSTPRIDHHPDPGGLEHVHDGVGDLIGEALLHL